MKAMVFAAGIGSRLKEFTAQMPKCLVPLGDGTTMLDRVVEKLVRAGVTEIILNLHHFGDQIEQHVEDKNYYGIAIEYSKEETLLGTGGGLKKASWFFSDGKPFVVHNSDIYSDVDLALLCDSHNKLASLATLAVMNRKTSRPLLFTEDLYLAGWNSGDNAGEVVPGVQPVLQCGFSGIQVLNPALFSFMDSFEGNFSTISVFMKAAAAGEKIAGFDMTASYWIDMGTPEKLMELKKHLEV